MKIKRILCMGRYAKFLRCPAKNYRTVKAFEAKGDLSHSKAKHVCRECRCTNVAGSRTKGDFYGLGEHTGHYGVGFCYKHHRGRYAAKAPEFALNQMKALQQYGRCADPDGDYRQVVKYQAEEAEENKNIRDGLKLVQDTIAEFREKCTNGTSLTEKCGKDVIKITDKSRMELATKLAYALSHLEIDRFKLEANSYVHIDEIRIRLRQMLSLANRFMHSEDDRKKFLEEFKNIWTSARQGIRNGKAS